MNTEEFTERVEEFLLDQVRDGNLSIEQLVERAVRYGMQTQREFIEEMSERMGIQVNQPKAFAIIGRIPDGENCTSIVLADNHADAVEEFTDRLYDDEERGARKRITGAYGSAVYIDGIISGENLEVIQ